MQAQEIKQRQRQFQKTHMTDEKCQKEIANFLNLRQRDTGGFSFTYMLNKIVTTAGVWNPYDTVEDFAYLGMLPSDDTLLALRGRIHSVVSLVNFHEYLSPFLMVTIQPHQLAQQQINHLMVPMTDFEAGLDTNVAVDALFNIALRIQEARAANQRVYFHCKAGRARSAMMLSLVLYHQHKYLDALPDPTYTLDKAIAAVYAARDQVDIAADKRATAKKIAHALDGAYQQYQKNPDGTIETRSLASPLFVWNEILQLPALKTLLIQAQRQINDGQSVDLLEGFFEEIKLGLDWYKDLNSKTPNSLNQKLKENYPDQIQQLLVEVSGKLHKVEAVGIINSNNLSFKNESH